MPILVPKQVSKEDWNVIQEHLEAIGTNDPSLEQIWHCLDIVWDVLAEIAERTGRFYDANDVNVDSAKQIQSTNGESYFNFEVGEYCAFVTYKASDQPLNTEWIHRVHFIPGLEDYDYIICLSTSEFTEGALKTCQNFDFIYYENRGFLSCL